MARKQIINLGLRGSKQEHEALRRLAFENHTSVQKLVTTAIHNYLAAEAKGGAPSVPAGRAFPVTLNVDDWDFLMLVAHTLLRIRKDPGMELALKSSVYVIARQVLENATSPTKSAAHQSYTREFFERALANLRTPSIGVGQQPHQATQPGLRETPGKVSGG
jgi:hypothetical protein